MQYAIEFGGAGPQDLTVTSTGQASLEDFVRLMDDVLGDERFRPGMAMLVDHSGADFSRLRTDEAQAVAQRLIDRDERFGPSRLAVVASSPASYGLIRVFEAYVDRAQVAVAVFYSRAEAEEWLREG